MKEKSRRAFLGGESGESAARPREHQTTDERARDQHQGRDMMAEEEKKDRQNIFLNDTGPSFVTINGLLQ